MWTINQYIIISFVLEKNEIIHHRSASNNIATQIF